MAFPEIAPIDGAGVEKALTTSVRKPDGSEYTAFRQTQEFIKSVRTLRDAAKATMVFASDIKGDLDQHKAADNERHATIATRLAAIEAQLTNSPFPG